VNDFKTILTIVVAGGGSKAIGTDRTQQKGSGQRQMRDMVSVRSRPYEGD
jgi:hypothetical protein